MTIGRRALLSALLAGSTVACRAAAAPARPAPSVEGTRSPAGVGAAAPSPAAGSGATAAAASNVGPTAAPAATRRAPTAALRPAAATEDPAGLQRRVEFFLSQQRGSFGVAVQELDGPVTAAVGERDRFTLASVYKLVLMYEVMRQVDRGQLGLDTRVRTAGRYTFGEPDGGVPADTEVSVDEAVGAMIRVSSNGAALALIDRVGAEALAAAPARLGMTDTTIDPRSTGEPGHYWVEAFGSARDLVELLARLGRQRLVSPALDRRMVEHLLGQRVADRLPLLLPPGTPVAHKTGDFDRFTHDAGLVLLPRRPFAIAVLAEGESLADGKAIVAELSRLAHAHVGAAG